ncbi:MAG: hypothetical protein F9B45_05760 [Phycisphaera sp. RhM]|nr:hypothetical protein [Phycisphaera sp. RhM]
MAWRGCCSTRPERHVEDDAQLHLFDLGVQQAENDDVEDDDATQPRRRRRNKKSETLPDHLNRKVIEADVLAVGYRRCDHDSVLIEPATGPIPRRREVRRRWVRE